MCGNQHTKAFRGQVKDQPIHNWGWPVFSEHAERQNPHTSRPERMRAICVFRDRRVPWMADGCSRALRLCIDGIRLGFPETSGYTVATPWLQRGYTGDVHFLNN